MNPHILNTVNEWDGIFEKDETLLICPLELSATNTVYYVSRNLHKNSIITILVEDYLSTKIRHPFMHLFNVEIRDLNDMGMQIVCMQMSKYQRLFMAPLYVTNTNRSSYPYYNQYFLADSCTNSSLSVKFLKKTNINIKIKRSVEART